MIKTATPARATATPLHDLDAVGRKDRPERQSAPDAPDGVRGGMFYLYRRMAESERAPLRNFSRVFDRRPAGPRGRPRSSPPIEPRCFRWVFPIWQPAPELDPAKLRTKPTGRKPTPTTPAEPPAPEWNTARFVHAFIGEDPRLRGAILVKANEAGLSDYAAEKFLEKTEAIGSIFRWDNGAHKTPSFATIPQPKLPLERGGESEGGSIVSKDTIAPPPHALPLPHGRKGKKTHG